MKFSVEGPFDVDLASFCRAKEKGHLPTWKSDFWARVDEAKNGLANAIGLYVFAIQHGNSKKPWYVGKTSAKGGFKVEVFQNHKSEHYASLRSKRGKGFFVFFPLITATGRLSSNTSSAKREIEWAEKRIITHALDRNSELLNTRDTIMHQSVFLPGIIGIQPKGKPGAQALLARAIFDS